MTHSYLSSQVIMLAYPSLKHIHQHLVTLIRLIQRSGTTARKLCTTLFRHLVLSFRFLLSRWQILCQKQRRRNFSSLGLTKPKIDESRSTINADGQSQPIIDEQVTIPLNNVACSLYPSIIEPHDGSSSSSSQTLNVVLQSPEMLSPSDDHRTTPSTRSSPHISVSDDSNSPIYATHIVSSPTVETRRLHHRQIGYPCHSMDSTEKLGSGEFSRDMTLVGHLSLDISTDEGTTCAEDLDSLETPVLFPSIRVRPVAPEDFPRHEKRRKIPEKATIVTMKPLLRDFSDYDDIPEWSTCTHPEGGRYFHNAEKRIFTDVDLHDHACFIKITEAIRIIDGLIAEQDSQMPEKTDLVLDLTEDGNGDEVVDYYFADHELRIVVFLHEFSSDNLPHWFEIKGVSSGTHLRHAVEMQYWWHCAAYPNCIELSDDLICELRSTVMHFIIDCMSSPYANSPYTSADLQNILANTDSLRNNVGKPYSGCISFMGRLMYQFSSSKFLNFYGQPEARLNRDDSVYGHSTNRRTWFIKSISIFLFSAPDVHLENLQKMWVDGMMHEAVWEVGLKKVTDEWQEFILYSTVMLNANVAFLSIQSVDVNFGLYRSPAQISSYCSITTSISSIILGLILVRQSRTKFRKETASEVQEFLDSWKHPWLGLETLAIMFSLPYALLMWSMVSFLLAFGFMCLQDTGVVTRSIIVPLCGVILILTVWCIWTSWRKQEPSNADKSQRTTLTFEEDHAKQKPKGFEFARDDSDTDPPTKSQTGRSMTLLSLTTTLKRPLEKLRRDTSKKSVDEESIELDDVVQLDYNGSVSAKCVDEKEESSSKSISSQ